MKCAVLVSAVVLGLGAAVLAQDPAKDEEKAKVTEPALSAGEDWAGTPERSERGCHIGVDKAWLVVAHSSR